MVERHAEVPPPEETAYWLARTLYIGRTLGSTALRLEVSRPKIAAKLIARHVKPEGTFDSHPLYEPLIISKVHTVIPNARAIEHIGEQKQHRRLYEEAVNGLRPPIIPERFLRASMITTRERAHHIERTALIDGMARLGHIRQVGRAGEKYRWVRGAVAAAAFFRRDIINETTDRRLYEDAPKIKAHLAQYSAIKPREGFDKVSGRMITLYEAIAKMPADEDGYINMQGRVGMRHALFWEEIKTDMNRLELLRQELAASGS